VIEYDCINFRHSGNAMQEEQLGLCGCEAERRRKRRSEGRGVNNGAGRDKGACGDTHHNPKPKKR